MKVHLHLSIESDAGHIEEIKEVITLERKTTLTPDRLGLSLAESKQVLQEMQQFLVAHQTATYVADQQQCPDCGAERKRKGTHEIVYRTLFGKLKIESPRFYTCVCQKRETRSSSPLADVLKERTAPELVYLESKFAALMSYGLTVELLAEVLPFAHERSVATVHRNLQRLAERAEQELGEEKGTFLEHCQRDLDALSPPAAPITVGLDGGYVYAKEQKSRTEGWFEVIVGKSLPQEGTAKCLAFVQKYDQKPKRRLYEVLQAQGVQANQSVIFLSDGGETVRGLPQFLIPESEHWLDWFHITLRLTVIGQMIKGLVGVPESSDHTALLSPNDELPSERASIAALEKKRESMKWNVWNGNVTRALARTEELIDDLETWPPDADKIVKLKKAVHEFAGYIALNQTSIPNYGDRRRHGERIASSFVESAVNQVVSKRIVKKQHMRWSERGAHLLLQVRTQVLNGDLRRWFSRWYPGMEAGADPMLLDQAAQPPLWNGLYKVHLTETCDEEGPHLITNVETTPVTTNDVDLTGIIHAHLAAHDVLPREHLVDTGYVDADHLVTSRATHGIDLVGPVLADTSWQARSPEGYEIACFTIDWPAHTVTCPPGKTHIPPAKPGV